LSKEYSNFYHIERNNDVRFFKEKQKEEFRVYISSSTGEVIGYKHTIKDTDARESKTREESKAMVVAFLKEHYGFDPAGYLIKGDLKTTLDHREDYSFTWQKLGASIPWSEKEGSGTGKLLIGAAISGTEILSYSKNFFFIPSDFNRDLSEKKNVGSIELRFTDDVETITIFKSILTDAPVAFGGALGGVWRGWKDARLEVVTVQDFEYTVTIGYVKERDGLTYADWDARR